MRWFKAEKKEKKQRLTIGSELIPFTNETLARSYSFQVYKTYIYRLNHLFAAKSACYTFYLESHS